MKISENTLAAALFCTTAFTNEPAICYKDFYKLKSALNSNLLNCKMWDAASILGKTAAEKIFSAQTRLQYAQTALEKLSEKGINIIGCDDSLYPKILTEKLGGDAPPCLFAKGNLSLLNKRAMAVTGSRDISEKGARFAADIGEVIASENAVIVSGGARGCDFSATKSAVDNGGYAVWFLPGGINDSLKNATVQDWYFDNKILFLTDCSPYGRFTREKALRRNLYIYALSEASFVCECKSRISGTYSGASKCLRQSLSKLYVYDTGADGEELLIKYGAIPITHFK